MNVVAPVGPSDPNHGPDVALTGATLASEKQFWIHGLVLPLDPPERCWVQRRDVFTPAPQLRPWGQVCPTSKQPINMRSGCLLMMFGFESRLETSAPTLRSFINSVSLQEVQLQTKSWNLITQGLQPWSSWATVLQVLFWEGNPLFQWGVLKQGNSWHLEDSGPRRPRLETSVLQDPCVWEHTWHLPSIKHTHQTLPASEPNVKNTNSINPRVLDLNCG